MTSSSMKSVMLALVLTACSPSTSIDTPAHTPSGREARGVHGQRKVLVAMSGAHLLTLREGTVYATGYYLNELVTPLTALIEAGYTPVFANPNGGTPSMDASSNNAKFFGGDDAKRMRALETADGLAQLRHPLTFAQVAPHADEYVGLFVPGGHAPMVDLVKDKDLGRILQSFHQSGRPTALICHGPMALLSALPDAANFDRALVSGDASQQRALAHDWPYAGYRVAIFSKAEEQQIEAPQLGGHVPYYNDEALAAAGAQVANAAPWQPNVVLDHELITGQQPFSDDAFARAFVAKLDASAR
jgi:putative intracellular protease/amidase